MKILVCVCMYNESKHAINLTLKGIYDNLKHLNNAGISPQEVAVVLLQDGILKLVQDRNKRTYAKGEDSMVHFYKKLDRDENKNHCALEERIHTILDEIEAANRNRTGNMVAQNRDFPPTLEKNIALLYQNEWHPSFTDFCEETGEMPYTDRNEKGEEQPEYRLKIFSCFKHLNGTKLSSHLWFFEGFCRYLKP